MKCDIPEGITNTIVQIFQNLQDGNETVSVEALKKNLRIDSHPSVRLMVKSPETILNEFEFSILFVSGDKGYLDINEFLELHRNMYWVQPKENLTNYLNMVLSFWNQK